MLGYGLALLVLGLLFFWSLKKSSSQFFTDTPWLLPLGVYVWGDGLVLFPLWIVILAVAAWVHPSAIELFQVYLGGIWLRSFFEVQFWLFKQMHDAEYIPPLVRRFKWMTAEQGGIIYQLVHFSIVLLIPALWFLTR